ncbi:pyruvate dehydrogenase E2 component (dihydrolipoamide acetyltransferase) [Gammaproteobacteria bacterium]
MAAQTILLPDIGDFKDVLVIEVLVKPGETIAPEQSLLILESDKATIEIPAPAAGTVLSVQVKPGDRVSQGSPVLELEPSQTPVPEQPALPPVPRPPLPAPLPPGEKVAVPPPLPLETPPAGGKSHASPMIRRFARELGVELDQVRGSGPKGRITRGDVQGFVQRALKEGAPTSRAPSPSGGLMLPPPLAVDFSRFGAIETVPLSRVKRLSGAHLHRCWVSIPHVTQFDEADITELESFRQSQLETFKVRGVRLSLLPFLLKAVAATLRALPNFNSSLAPDGEHLVLKQYLHIGVAVETPQGLMVPVVREVDGKGLSALATELADLGQRARDGKLLPGDLQGGCFTISSLGGIGGTAFTPIVNQPEVAILGVSRSALKPCWDGKQWIPRLMLPLSLSYDHRVIDGAEGARFTRHLGELLGDIRRLLI